MASKKVAADLSDNIVTGMDIVREERKGEKEKGDRSRKDSGIQQYFPNPNDDKTKKKKPKKFLPPPSGGQCTNYDSNSDSRDTKTSWNDGRD